MSLPWIYSLNKRTAKIWFPTGRRQINCRRMSIPKKRGTLPREIRYLLDLNLISDETRFDTPLISCICFHWLFQRGGGRRFIRRPLWPPWAASSTPKQRVDCPALPGQPASGRYHLCRDRIRNHPSSPFPLTLKSTNQNSGRHFPGLTLSLLPQQRVSKGTSPFGRIP